MNEGEEEASRVDKVAKGHYFDFNLQDYMERDKGDPRVSRANMAAGLEFNPDAQSLGSMRTVEYAAWGTSSAREVAAPKPLMRGVEGLQEATTAGSQASAEGSARLPANGGGTAQSEPPLSSEPGHCGGSGE